MAGNIGILGIFAGELSQNFRGLLVIGAGLFILFLIGLKLGQTREASGVAFPVVGVPLVGFQQLAAESHRLQPPFHGEIEVAGSVRDLGRLAQGDDQIGPVSQMLWPQFHELVIDGMGLLKIPSCFFQLFALHGQHTQLIQHA